MATRNLRTIALKLKIKKTITWLGTHKAVSCSILFAFLALIICFIKLAPINLYYVVSLSDNASVSDSVIFKFDNNPGYEESATQKTGINYNPHAVAKLRIDPANEDSKSLKISIPENNVTIQQLSVVVSVNGKTLYHTSSINGYQLSHSTNNNKNAYQLTEKQMSTIWLQAQLKSEVKLFVLSALLLLYLAFILRLTIFSSSKQIYYLSGLLIACLVIGFVANTALVKQPIELHRETSSSTATPVQQADRFSITQSITPAADVSSITLPVTITNGISPTDSNDPNYKSVYYSSQRFKDEYQIAITQGVSHILIFKGLITPSMLNADLNQISIEANAPKKNGAVDITVSKLNDSTVPTLVFQTTRVSVNKSFATTQNITAKNLFLAVGANYSEFNYRGLIILLVIGFCIILLINLLALRRFFSRFKFILSAGNYLIMLCYSCMQFLIYSKYVNGFPDELAHISYIAYLRKFGTLVPNFAQMKVYALGSAPDSFDISHAQSFNYLGHPPLYYQIMKLLNGVTIKGNIASFNISQMRLESFCIAMLGVGILFYIGLTRLPKIPLLHLLYGLLIISPPNLIYCVSGVTNDSLTILTVAISLLGFIRFSEKRYSVFTYSLIALGIVTSLLTKLTAGLIVSSSAICILAYSLFKEKGITKICSWKFLITIPLYVPIVLYFGYLHVKYHTIQPNFASLAYHEYVHSGWYTPIGQRPEMGVWGFLTTYISNFVNTWYNLAGATATGRAADWPFFSLDRIGIVLILLIPFILFFVKAKDRRKKYLQFGILGIVVALLIQLQGTYSSVMQNGRFGGYSSRYYLCGVGILALAVMWIFCQYFTNNSGMNLSKQVNTDVGLLGKEAEEMNTIDTQLTSQGILLCASFCLLLFFDGFIYSVLYQAPNISGFAQ
ncbi:hypothetical protein [Bifidobacterium aquikefiri]|uniref:hypothetical protein n=1 Tax=Bifidobacterium aquikefiri TaxID=1653207 RepID=UPI0039EBF9A1